MYCNKCGNNLEQGDVFCSKCGNRIGYSYSGNELEEPNFQGNSNLSYETPNLSYLPEGYQREFRKIAESGEIYKGRWNWAAFLFGPIWALTKGLWLSALVCIVLSFITYGIAGYVYWFIFGFRGTYMYYCLTVKHKQILF